MPYKYLWGRVILQTITKLFSGLDYTIKLLPIIEFYNEKPSFFAYHSINILILIQPIVFPITTLINK